MRRRSVDVCAAHAPEWSAQRKRLPVEFMAVVFSVVVFGRPEQHTFTRNGMSSKTEPRRKNELKIYNLERSRRRRRGSSGMKNLLFHTKTSSTVRARSCLRISQCRFGTTFISMGLSASINSVSGPVRVARLQSKSNAARIDRCRPIDTYTANNDKETNKISATTPNIPVWTFIHTIFAPCCCNPFAASSSN